MNKKLQTKIRKIFTLVAVIAILIQSVSPGFSLLATNNIAYAQEETATPTVDLSLPTITPSESPVPDQLTDSPTPTVASTDSSTTSTDTTATNVSVPETPTPPAKPQPQPTLQSEKNAASWTDTDGVYTTKDPVQLNQSYHAPQNDNVIVTFTKLSDNPGKLSIKEIKLTKEQIAQTGALYDSAYEITSDMPDGTFTYNLTLPYVDDNNDGRVGNSETSVNKLNITYSEDGKNFQKANTKTTANSEQKIVTITDLDHFTIFLISADTTGGSYTTTTGPSIVETANRQLGTGTIILNAPIGFAFNTGVTVNAIISSTNVNTACFTLSSTTATSGAGTLTASTITFTVSANDASSGSSKAICQVVFSGIQIRPTVGTPLASGDITRTGTAALGGATFNTNTFTETVGAVSASVSTTSASLSSVAADGATTSTITVTLKDVFGNPVASKSVTLAKTSGPGTPTITTVSGTTNASGQASFTVVSSTVGTDVFTATDTTDSNLVITQTASVTFIDVSAPSVPGTPTTTTPTNNTKPAWTWTASTDNVAADHYVFYWDTVVGGETNNSSISSASFTHSVALANGTWYGKVKAFDAAGNNSVSSNGSVVIDTAAPSGTMVINNNAAYTTSHTVSLNFSSVSADVTQMQLANGTVGSFQTAIVYENPHAYTLPNNGDGTYTVRARFIDSAGNVSSSTSDTIIVDTATPTTSDSGIDTNWHNSDIAVTLTCLDGGSGCATTYYTTDNSTPTATSSAGNSFTLSSNGTYTIKYFSKDNAGNSESVKTATNTVKIDKTAPVISADKVISGWYTAKPTITLSASDALSGLVASTVRYVWDGTASASAGTVFTDGATTTIPSEGTHTLSLYGQDVAGNSNTFSATYKLDTSDPTVLATGAQINWQTLLPTITITASDAISGIASVKYAWNSNAASGSATSDGADITSTYPGDGTQTLNMLVTDNSGRSASASGTYKVDRVAPSVVVVTDSGTKTSNPLLSFTWPSATDTASGISFYQFWLATSASESAALDLDSNSLNFWKNIGNVTTYTLTSAESALLTTGTQYFAQVKAVDAAGNIASNTLANWSDGITFDTTVTPSQISTLLDGGVFSIPSGSSTTSASSVTTTQPVIINVTAATGGISSVSLPSGTVITKTDGTNLDATALTSSDTSASSLSGLGSGTVADGAMQWGIPNIGLTFSTPITLNIFVGTALNGQTLDVRRSVDGVTWTQDGIEAPKTCIVIAGLCTFRATKASYYASTHVSTSSTTSSTSSSSSSSSSGGGSSSAASCNDSKPGSAPTLISATGGINSVTLVWSGASDPVSYYLITYGTSSGSQTYGNPNIGGKDTTSYTVNGLSGGNTYYFRIRAGNGCTPGDYSNEVSAAPSGAIFTGVAAGFTQGVLGAENSTSVEKHKNTAHKSVKGATTVAKVTVSNPQKSQNIFSSFLSGIASFFHNFFNMFNR